MDLTEGHVLGRGGLIETLDGRSGWPREASDDLRFGCRGLVDRDAVAKTARFSGEIPSLILSGQLQGGVALSRLLAEHLDNELVIRPLG